MYQLVERPLNDRERNWLIESRPLTPSPLPALKRNLLSYTLAELVGMALAAAYALWLLKLPPAVVLVAGLLLYALYWIAKLKSRLFLPLRKHREGNEKARAFHDAVNAIGTVRVHRVEAGKVVEVLHDEGAIYLFDLGNQTYWIDPYIDMIPGPPKNRWPNSRFEVINAPGWKEQIGPFCYGRHLKPERTLEFRDYFAEFDFDNLPPDGVINNSVESFLETARAQSNTASDARDNME